jgi:hypothetical protein
MWLADCSSGRTQPATNDHDWEDRAVSRLGLAPLAQSMVGADQRSNRAEHGWAVTINSSDGLQLFTMSWTSRRDAIRAARASPPGAVAASFCHGLGMDSAGMGRVRSCSGGNGGCARMPKTCTNRTRPTVQNARQKGSGNSGLRSVCNPTGRCHSHQIRNFDEPHWKVPAPCFGVASNIAP